MLQLIAHRGASKYAPENTMSAFMLAHQMGARHIECDVILCADKVPIVMHDDDLERTTNGRGKVRSATFSYIQSLDAGSWFGDEFSGTSVLSLRELLLWQKEMGVYLHLEIKPLGSNFLDHALEIIMSHVYQYGEPEKIKILTFQYEILQCLLRWGDKLPRVLGVNICSKKIINLALDVGCVQVNAYHHTLSKSHILQIQRSKMKSGAFTVNESVQLERLKALGIDVVYTDDLKLTLS